MLFLFELWHLLTKSLDLKDVASPFKKLVPKNNLDRSIRLDKAIHVHKKLEEARKDLEFGAAKVLSSSESFPNLIRLI